MEKTNKPKNKDTEGLEFKSPDIQINETKWKTEFGILDQNGTNSLVLHISEAFQPLFLQGIYVLFHQLRRINNQWCIRVKRTESDHSVYFN